jgi:hypothetical protein
MMVVLLTAINPPTTVPKPERTWLLRSVRPAAMAEASSVVPLERVLLAEF